MLNPPSSLGLSLLPGQQNPDPKMGGSLVQAQFNSAEQPLEFAKKISHDPVPGNAPHSSVIESKKEGQLEASTCMVATGIGQNEALEMTRYYPDCAEHPPGSAPCRNRVNERPATRLSRFEQVPVYNRNKLDSMPIVA